MKRLLCALLVAVALVYQSGCEKWQGAVAEAALGYDPDVVYVMD